VAETETYNAVVQSIAHPEPERGLGKEHVLLAKHVELWISIQNPRGHKLVEDANDQGRKDCENDIV